MYYPLPKNIGSGCWRTSDHSIYSSRLNRYGELQKGEPSTGGEVKRQAMLTRVRVFSGWTL